MVLKHHFSIYFFFYTHFPEQNTSKYLHEPPWFLCRNRSCLWAELHGVLKECGQSLVSVWLRPHSYCIKTNINQQTPILIKKNNTLLLKARKPQWYMAIYDVCRSRDRRAYFAIVMRPTLFSGLLRVFEWQTMLTASCWACSLVGKKSPFLIYSLLSTLNENNKIKLS